MNARRAIGAGVTSVEAVAPVIAICVVAQFQAVTAESFAYSVTGATRK